jgi:hypothetical protein
VTWRRLRRLGTGVAVAVVAGVLVAGVMNDVQLHRQLHGSESQVSTTRTRVREASGLLASAVAAEHRDSAADTATRSSLAQVTTELEAAKQSLARAGQGVSSGAIEVGDAHACAGGVHRR